MCHRASSKNFRKKYLFGGIDSERDASSRVISARSLLPVFRPSPLARTQSSLDSSHFRDSLIQPLKHLHLLTHFLDLPVDLGDALPHYVFAESSCSRFTVSILNPLSNNIIPLSRARIRLQPLQRRFIFITKLLHIYLSPSSRTDMTATTDRSSGPPNLKGAATLSPSVQLTPLAFPHYHLLMRLSCDSRSLYSCILISLYTVAMLLPVAQ